MLSTLKRSKILRIEHEHIKGQEIDLINLCAVQMNIANNGTSSTIVSSQKPN